MGGTRLTVPPLIWKNTVILFADLDEAVKKLFPLGRNLAESRIR